jgi:cytoskeletal protein CcmA (bactofilin family)
MMHCVDIRIAIACLLAALSLATGAGAATIHTETGESGNTFMGGADLRIETPVAADLMAAGGRVSVEREVGADAALAGGTVDVRAPVKQDLRVAGGTVDVEANVDGDLAAAGGSVTLDNKATVRGETWLAGGTVAVDGRLAKGAKIYANDFTLNGEIDGNTRLFAQQIHFAPGARINGNLVYASAQPLTSEQAARVTGSVTREAMPERPRRDQVAARAAWLAPVYIASMLLAGMLLNLLAPQVVAGSREVLRTHPARSILIGLAILFTLPPLAIATMATVIGIPVGLALFALYPLLLLAGYLIAAFFVGYRAADVMKLAAPAGWGGQVLRLGMALVLLGVVAWIPFLGPLVLMLVLTAGIGALGYSLTMGARTNAA